MNGGLHVVEAFDKGEKALDVRPDAISATAVKKSAAGGAL